MIEAGIGRLLVASLHQAIADLLPTRLEFYEGWLNPAGLRDGRIGLAPLAAVLSFLRQEGEPYRLVAARAGDYTAEWAVADMPAFKRAVIRAVPPVLRVRLVMRVACSIVHRTCRTSRASIRWRKGIGAVTVHGSIFCGVRGHVEQPLCEFYASVIRRVMSLFGLDAEVGIVQCVAIGADHCLMEARVGPAGVAE